MLHALHVDVGQKCDYKLLSFMVGNVYGCMKFFNFQEILVMSLLFIIAYCNISVVVQYSLSYLSLLGQTGGIE